MSELLQKIRSRGYWRVIIRPYSFMENRIADRAELLHVLEKASVEFKGWGFPHIDAGRTPDEGPDWIGQEICWDCIRELWRFYQSGQFIHYFGMPEDWDKAFGLLPQFEGKVSLDPKVLLLQFTEIFEFASRLTFTDAGDEGLRVDIKVDNIKDHLLILPGYGSGKASWIPKSQKKTCTTRQMFRRLNW